MTGFGKLGLPVNASLFAMAAFIVWICGTRIIHAVDALARRTGMGQAFAGMVLLGGITSLPELSAVVSSAATGNAPLAVNNLLGSVSINVLLIAVADAAIGRRAITAEVGSASTLMQGALGIVAKLVLVIAPTPPRSGHGTSRPGTRPRCCRRRSISRCSRASPASRSGSGARCCARVSRRFRRCSSC